MSLLSCNRQSCSTLPHSFNSFDSAKEIVYSTHFNITDQINTTKSSWILSAKYFSCDKEKGFLLIRTGKNEYLHQDVPIDIWLKFKKARSYGKFYNNNIKSRYQLNIFIN